MFPKDRLSACGDHMKLTIRSSAALTLPAGKREHIYWDDDVAGLGLRLREGGSRTWVYRYRVGNTQRKMKLGSAKAVPLVTARANAAKLEARVRLGEDPAAVREIAKRDAGYTFDLVAERFLDARRPELRPATILEYERHLRRDAKSLHRLPITAVTQADIAKLLSKATGPVSANRLRSTLHATFVWTMQQGTVLPAGNPVANTEKRTERSRDRVLSDTELKTIWAALGDDDHARILKLLILTGARADEIGGLKWRELKDDAIELPGNPVKNGRPYTILLSRPAKTIVAAIPRTDRVHVFGRDDTGFQGWSKCKLRLDQKLGDAVAAWVVHDLRRTAASGMQRLGVRVEVIERVLNHVSGSFRGVAGIYQRDAMADGVRTALQRWGRHVVSVVEGRAPTVVPLRRA
jgi:integrase